MPRKPKRQAAARSPRRRRNKHGGCLIFVILFVIIGLGMFLAAHKKNNPDLTWPDVVEEALPETVRETVKEVLPQTVKEEIEKVRKRSKAASDGPWVTDWDEMAKKTVIKRHAKLAPLSVEFQRAVALEDRANLGESQADLLGMDDDDVIDADAQRIEDNAAGLKAFDDSIPKGTDAALLDRFLSATADRNKTTVETLKVEAGKKPADFWKFFNAWAKQEQAKAVKGGQEAVKQAEPADVTDTEPMSAPCPNTVENYKEKYCAGCPDRKGCPAW